MSNSDSVIMHDFLDRCDLSRLDEEESTQLDSEISVNEVSQAIKSFILHQAQLVTTQKKACKRQR